MKVRWKEAVAEGGDRVGQTGSSMAVAMAAMVLGRPKLSLLGARYSVTRHGGDRVTGGSRYGEAVMERRLCMEAESRARAESKEEKDSHSYMYLCTHDST